MAEERTIKGFGAKAGGKKLLHVICEDGGALCDKRLTGFGKVHTVLTEVTCPKCKGYSVYKALMAGFIVGDDLNEIKKVLAERKPGEPKTKDPGKPETGAPKTNKKKPAAKKKEPVYPPKGPLEKGKKKKKEKAKPIEKRNDWNLLWNEEKTFCDILHKPSQKVFFEGIKGNIALIALENLNKMKIFWLPKEPIPKDFVFTARSIVGKAYKKTGNKIPGNLAKPTTKTKEKPKKKEKEKPKAKGRAIKRRAKPKKEGRVIKRRSPKKEKETKRTIKRRSEKPKKEVHIITEMFGRREGTAGFTVIEMLSQGMTSSKMVKKLMKKHSLTEQKAKSKIKGIMRKTARSQGIPIIIQMNKKEEDDIYGLKEYLDI